MSVVAYTHSVPRLWTQTIAAHRREVRDAIVEATAALVAERGLLGVTMSEIAEQTGIGRATLYKYFPDVESILLAWHEGRIQVHLEYLSEVRDRESESLGKLEAVLEAYALIDHEHHGSHGHRQHLQDPRLAALLHRGGHVIRAERQLQAMIRALVIEAKKGGEIRQDVSPDELANYGLHALSASNRLTSKAAVRRLVSVTLDGMRSPR
jgi:AcrR family transcriptional regulator